MIKEFWQEQREEKKKQKQLKKQRKKSPKTKEQTAYKVFGILFTLFVIFGALYNSGIGRGEDGDFDWGSVTGITEEVVAELSAPVDNNLILIDGRLSNGDWEDAQDVLSTNNINIVKDGKLDIELLASDNLKLNQNLTLSTSSLGALTYRLIEDLGYGEDVELLSFNIYTQDDGTYLRTVAQVDLSKVVPTVELPTVYVTTTSRLRVLNNAVTSLGASVRLNLIEDERNAELVELINNSSFSEISYYTNTHFASQLNALAEFLNCKIEINGTNINFVTK